MKQEKLEENLSSRMPTNKDIIANRILGLERLPGVRCVIVWTDDDAKEHEVNPEAVNWKAVQGRGIEIGWDIIDEARRN